MKNLLICGAVAITCFNPVNAIAVPVVRTIKQTQASGESAKLQTINVWNGHGVIISFYEVGETIKRVWLDDPSQILVDTDGCLEGIDQNCQNTGAGLIHLKRIKKVNVPGLPQTLTTLLTIITQTSDGERKAYSFRLTTSNGIPKYSQVVIKSDVAVEEKKVAIPQLQSLITSSKTTRNIRNGIAVAIRKKWINPKDELHQRLEKFIILLYMGDEISTAADKASVSMELVNKLISLGNSSQT
ncbi:hypothetical protein [Halotia branconii]|uniref:Uncharacterized protein n=1 Tax=Halotia branconii CENA392 TaxID=1539056 RepID=A0AAJ6NYG8_9CYAN|nr:hypothetical protein [Halotia branconii]WGV29074.1 hypothetical protein QI031_31435 [Halotia branconii CENA392]